MPPKRKPFAQVLIAWRKKNKLSRVQAAELLGVPYRTLQDWELEIHTPGNFAQAAIKSLLNQKVK